MADPGFPRGGGANSPGGAPSYNFAKFSQKLHEIERIWPPRGGARPKFYYVDPPLHSLRWIYPDSRLVIGSKNESVNGLFVLNVLVR